MRFCADPKEPFANSLELCSAHASFLFFSILIVICSLKDSSAIFETETHSKAFRRVMESYGLLECTLMQRDESRYLLWYLRTDIPSVCTCQLRVGRQA